MKQKIIVGREYELDRLTKLLDRAIKGEGQVCFVIGEAGIGKTTIMKAFAQQAQRVYPDLVVVFGGCHAHAGQCDPYLPFREMLRLLMGDFQSKLAHNPVDGENTNRLKKLGVQSAQVLIDVAPALLTLIPVVGPFLRVSADLAPVIAELGIVSAAKFTGLSEKLDSLADTKEKKSGVEVPTLEQAQIFEQYTNFLRNLALQQPLLVMVDDLQWADAPSINLFYHLSRCIEESRILIIGAYRQVEVSLGRDGNRHPLDSVVSELKRYYGEIEIDLSLAQTDQGRKFVNEFLDTEANRLNNDFREALYKQTEGHPLFTIELLRVMQERGDIKQDVEGYWVTGPTLNWDTLPARVEGVIEERIRRLDQEMLDVLSIASVEGERFIAQVIMRIKDIQERNLLRYLSQGLEKRHRLLKEIGEVKIRDQVLSQYKFSHIMIQQYLYNNLGTAERRLLHEEIATTLEEMYLDQSETIAVTLARHYSKSGKMGKAIEYYFKAGQMALKLSAHEEAISSLTKGLLLLKTLPDNAERNQLELKLQVTLGPAVMAIKGHSVPEVADIYTRALELCQQMGDTLYLFPILFRLAGIYLRRGELQARKDVGERLFSLARDACDPALLLQAHLAQGLLFYYLGDFSRARENLERVLDLYNPQIHFPHAFIYGKDPGITSLNILSQVLWYLGYPDKALNRINESLSLARELNHPFSLGYTLVSAAVLHTLRREEIIAQKWAEEAISLSKQRGFELWLTAGMFHRGLAIAEHGQTSSGIAMMEHSLADWRAKGAELGVRNWPGLLCEWYGKAGQMETGLELLAEELASKERSREGVAISELYRIRGELLMAQSGADAETDFNKAIDISRCQKAKSLELRAVMSLSRLWQKQGKRQEAHKTLSEIYNWFTEGFDTDDLAEVRSLLDELA